MAVIRWRNLVPLEAEEQEAYFSWLEFVKIDGQPARPHFHAVPNGGSRHPAEAAHLKAQGVTAGVPDISGELACGPYHGLRIEMKRIAEQPTTQQRAAIERLNDQGFYARVCHGFDDARRTTVAYLAQRFRIDDPWIES